MSHNKQIQQNLNAVQATIELLNEKRKELVLTEQKVDDEKQLLENIIKEANRLVSDKERKIQLLENLEMQIKDKEAELAHIMSVLTVKTLEAINTDSMKVATLNKLSNLEQVKEKAVKELYHLTEEQRNRITEILEKNSEKSALDVEIREMKSQLKEIDERIEDTQEFTEKQQDELETKRRSLKKFEKLIRLYYSRLKRYSKNLNIEVSIKELE